MSQAHSGASTSSESRRRRAGACAAGDGRSAEPTSWPIGHRHGGEGTERERVDAVERRDPEERHDRGDHGDRDDPGERTLDPVRGARADDVVARLVDRDEHEQGDHGADLVAQGQHDRGAGQPDPDRAGDDARRRARRPVASSGPR